MRRLSMLAGALLVACNPTHSILSTCCAMRSVRATRGDRVALTCCGTCLQVAVTYLSGTAPRNCWGCWLQPVSGYILENSASCALGCARKRAPQPGGASAVGPNSKMEIAHPGPNRAPGVRFQISGGFRSRRSGCRRVAHGPFHAAADVRKSVHA